ncbi:predicted protein [Nematostella vectensis]|uniref:Uncharacterized protein n=1 Tax=Nematostella vectensis TaxID=45351 RepID=A7RWU0_NEMVE|nr:predicted protein [Nematostella vectensis]|eukprot:XP_001636096.1 predicted protein [Nematostella vectensis]
MSDRWGHRDDPPLLKTYRLLLLDYPALGVMHTVSSSLPSLLRVPQTALSRLYLGPGCEVGWHVEMGGKIATETRTDYNNSVTYKILYHKLQHTPGCTRCPALGQAYVSRWFFPTKIF